MHTAEQQKQEFRQGEPVNFKQQAPTIGQFTLQATLPHGKTANVSTYLLEGESEKSINDRLDVIHAILDRQRTYAEIPELELKLAAKMDELENINRHFSHAVAQRDSGVKLTAEKKTFLSHYETNVDYLVNEIKKGEKAISDAKAKLVRKD